MPSKEGVEKNQKRKSLLRALTANRLMAEAVRFELTCRLLDNLISSLGRWRSPHQRFQNVHDLIVFNICRVSKLLAVFLPHGVQLRAFFDIA